MVPVMWVIMVFWWCIGSRSMMTFFAVMQLVNSKSLSGTWQLYNSSQMIRLPVASTAITYIVYGGMNVYCLF